MSRALVEKVDNMQVQMGNVSIHNSKKYLKENATNNSTTKMNNAFNGLISRRDMAKERTSEFKGISIETSQTKCKGEK